MSSDVFVYVAQHQAPSDTDLQSAVAQMEGVYVDVYVAPQDLSLEGPATAYVAHTIGAFRVDVITYRGGSLESVADVLERFYCDVRALADADGDGIFTIPELTSLLRGSDLASFHPRADPRMRRG